MRGAKYVMHIEHDPSGTYSEGAQIPYGEFLAGLRMGIFSEGLKVSKRAETSEFVVAVAHTGSNYLVDKNRHRWRIVHNSGNASGYQLQRSGPLNPSEEHREKNRERSSIYYKKNREKINARQREYRARRRNIGNSC